MSDKREGGDGRGHSVCPWWMIYTFDNPLRKLVQPPEKALHGMAGPGDHCLDMGCGMGYFTIPLARRVGPSGSVTAVDVQQQMLDGLMRRARRQGLSGAIAPLLVSDPGWESPDRYDFVLAFWMVHEVPDREGLFRSLRRVLKESGRALVAEPVLHVGRAAFEETLGIARRVGLRVEQGPKVFGSRSAILTRPRGSGGQGGDT